MKVTLNFTTPAAGNQSSTFTLTLDSTPNTGTDQQNADFVFFPSTFSNTTFSLGGINYTLEITGFQFVSGQGSLDSSGTQFHVLEGGMATANILGVVTANIPSAPEPSTIVVAMTGLGTLGLAGLRRRLRKAEAKA